MNTNSQFYLHTTPSGIELIEGDKMPVRPKPEDYGYSGDGYTEWYCDQSTKSKYYKNAYRKYQAALQAAKASGIPVKDQERAKDLIASLRIELGSEATVWASYQNQEGAIYGSFNISYELVEACGNDSCAMDAGCEHCQKPVKVAILLHEKDIDTQFAEAAKQHIENAPTKTYRVIAEKEEQEDVYAEVIRLARMGPASQDEYIKQNFTITRKQ